MTAKYRLMIQLVCGIFLFVSLVMIIVMKGLKSNLENYTNIMKNISITQLLNTSLNEGVLRSRSLNETRDFLSLDAAQLRENCDALVRQSKLYVSAEAKFQSIKSYCQLVDSTAPNTKFVITLPRLKEFQAA